LTGQDVEYWGGNYGSRFSKHRLWLELGKLDEGATTESTVEESKEQICGEKPASLFDQLGYRKVDMGLEENFGWSSFFQQGKGAAYYIDGQRIDNADGACFYTNLNEFDCSLAYLRTKENVEHKAHIVSYGDHYIGSSSLLLKAKGEEREIIL
jgi:hypothetical protein